MMSGYTSRHRAWTPADAELEARATALLRTLGAFRRGTGIRSPRSEEEARHGTLPWDDWIDDRVDELGTLDLRHEADELARAARLTPLERTVFYLSRVGQFSLREMMDLLGISLHRAHRTLLKAARKLERLEQRLGAEGPPLSARALFWLEVRQKRASVYRRPLRSRPRR